MKVEIKNGDLSLIKSGSLIVYESQSVTITLDEQYSLIFSFLEDSTLKEQKIDISPLEMGVEFKLTNFNNPIGTATNKPIVFATANEKEVSVSFVVYSVSKAKVLHYNIYSE